MANEAASKLQKMYRGELNKRWWKAYKYSVYTTKATKIQRVWRGMSGRKSANTHRAIVEEKVGTKLVRVVIGAIIHKLNHYYIVVMLSLTTLGI